ncbi:unnamed protein product [Kuraishia capsulata CBS 1993]|uniref:Alanyl-transfer RNA synthetases family profile domain-containing protein n=1 Tax=Kuraishia capsulata CBS 1993 TaxID=1382522 RepID=W6MI56_9ASCO|nr:uncharacterized protein KUCA_T00001776001 [Kuraishia capsulata CBS 1993]CDK25806.1 unnamed protein product [Kuraishia capsulata CBS 1993]
MSLKARIVGDLLCQRDSYLTKLTTQVVSCNKLSDTQYELELEDTVLFPEGGGQPTDHGTIKIDDTELEVTEVKRNGLNCYHMVSQLFKPGDTVELKVDWRRRFDHMQQHTGQHLLSAILDKFNLPTLSWSMGEMINYIEIPRKLTPAELEEVSQMCNDKITENIKIQVEVPDKDSVKKDKMPSDYDLEKGILRVIHIGELDSNPCCGTHLSSTGQIKSITLLNQFPGKKSASRINFLCGDRISKFTSESFLTLKDLTGKLSCQTDDLVEKVEALQLSHRKAASKEMSLMKELAEYQSKELLAKLESSEIAFLCRSDVGLEYFNNISKKLLPLTPGKTLVLIGNGCLIISGPQVEEVSTQLKQVLKGLKGGGKGKFQGKFTFNQSDFNSAEKYLESL